MNNGLVITLITSGIVYGTPLVLAGLGELLTERSGVLNLGLEGMMLMGAVCAFAVSQNLGGPSWLALVVALIAAIVAGTLMSLIHAFVTITLRANQVVSGLALTIFGGAVGLSSYLAGVWHLGGTPGRHRFGPIDVFGLGNLPIVGPIFFHQDVIVYLTVVLVACAAWYLHHTRIGLHLRAVGENPHAADSMGVNVTRYRYVHTLVGGALAGVGGAYFSLAITPSWTNGLTTGAGWIALGLVIFAFWRPGLLLIGGYLFGLITGLGFNLQAHGVTLPPEVFSALPYFVAIVALVLVSSVWGKRRLAAPAALAQPYAREER
ncbi:MAG: ABC transporter permease [Actinobacteria bacterium]|nr:ABC transporter permease [Actinomycetota bacterium]